MEWLVIWGATQAVGLVFKPILEDLAKESVKDYAKDVFKDCLKKVIHLPEKDQLKEAYGKALKEFLQLIQQELEDADYDEALIRQYIQPLKQFVKTPEVEAILGSAFDRECQGLDTRTLRTTWHKLNLPVLPDEFDWGRVSKRYLKKVKAIIRESEKLRPIFEAQSQEASAESLQEMAGIPPEFDLGRYREGLLEQYGNVRLESLDTTGCAYNELKLWRIFVAQNVRECQEFLPQVYEIPKEHLRRLQESGQLEEAEIAQAEVERYRKVYVEQPIRPVLEVVGDPGLEIGAKGSSPLKYVVILGDPGSGKSSLLQYIALKWAERPLKDLPAFPIPLLIELRTYARNRQGHQCKDVLEFVHSGSITCRLNQRQLHERLKKGEAIAMFDGLDEVFDPALRDEVVTDIHRFTNEYPQVQVIVTSRWLGYKAQRLRDAEFRHFMLQDLESAQIVDFMQRWHDLTFTDEVDKVRKRERLQKAITDSKAIQELAGNPLLLTMMAILNRNQELPRDRPELYNQASRVLLHQWDVERTLIEDQRLDPKTIDYKDKQAMLRKVAYQMQANAKGLAGNLISTTDLENILTEYLKTIEVAQPRNIARLLINQLRTRNFILCYLGADSYAFVHRTFLEYFCAWEFVWQFKETQTLSFEQLKNEVFANHWQDESWHEVLRLVAGMIDAKFVGETIDYLMVQKVDKRQFVNPDTDLLRNEGLLNLLLAANCLAEIRNKNTISQPATKLLKALKREAESEYPYRLAPEAATAITTVIATNWKDTLDTLSWLKSCIDLDPSSYIPDAAVKAIAQHWQDNPDTLPWLKSRARNDNNYNVRRAAVQELARSWPNNPATLSILKSRTQNDQNWNVRRTAMQELVRGWPNDPDTFTILKSCAQYDADNDVRRTAVEELARGWPKNPDTLTILKSCTEDDENDFVRRVAVRELARGWPNDTNTLTILKSCAQYDDDNDVRKAAVQELARGWPNDPDTLPWLKSRAQNDENDFVRKAAVQELARGWPNDPDTLPWLKSRIQNDYSYAVRTVVVEELARGWPNDSDTLTILKSLAQSNDNWYMRRVAVEELARGWSNDPDTLPILKSRAQNDDSYAVRRAAVEELARGWPNDPDTLPILKSFAQNDDNYFVRKAALQALARGWPNDPDTLLILKSRAQNDNSYDVRAAALQTLAHGWPNDPDTLLILKSRAQNDDDNNVRMLAVQALARGWQDAPEMFKFLSGCALKATFRCKSSKKDNLRQIALAVIIKNYPDHPQTLELLNDRAQNDPDEKVKEYAKKQLERWQQR